MKSMNRRDFLTALTAAGLASPALALGVTGRPTGRAPAFLHGVASGDPLHDRVILWTRITPSRLDGSAAVQWRIAKDRSLRNPIAAGAAVTDPRRDFTVKVDVTGLEPGRTYYYGFRSEGVDSPVGRTRTLPVGVARSLRFAFVSCSNFPYGYFNAYRRIAERHDLDFVLHLGDYLYEYPIGVYANPALAGVRDVVPSNEIVSLADYRLRHALYRTDADLQELHRQHPMICVWDDHESANDAWRDGAENHNPELGEGEWSVRRAAAARAYDEYLPIRTSPQGVERIYRRFQFGQLADLIMLDTRLHGHRRPEPLAAGLRPGGVALRHAVAVQVARCAMAIHRAAGDDGAARRTGHQRHDHAQPGPVGRLFRHLVDNYIDNTVVLTGDIHSGWCNDLAFNPWDAAGYNPANGLGVVGVEFVAPAVSSPGPIPNPAEAIPTAAALRATSPHMKFVDLYQRGYGLVDADAERVQGEIWHVPTVDSPAQGEQYSAGFVDASGANGLQPAGGPSPNRTAADPA